MAVSNTDQSHLDYTENSDFHFKVYNYSPDCSPNLPQPAHDRGEITADKKKKKKKSSKNVSAALDKWKEQIKHFTNEKAIVQWYRPISVLIKGGTLCPEKGGTFNRLYHDFFVFELNEQDGHMSAASIERGNPDIIFQYCKGEKDNVAQVRDFRLGKQRKEVHSWKQESFGTFVTVGLYELVQDMNAEDLKKGYNLFWRNCQMFANDFKHGLYEYSLDLELKIPGSDKTTKLKEINEDSNALNFIEENFPKWKEGQEVELIPKDQNLQRDVIGEIELPEETTDKESVVKAMQAYLKEEKGRKAIVTNVSKESFRETVINSRLPENCLEESQPIDVENISMKWKSALDMVVISESFGVAVVTFMSGEVENDALTNSQIEETKLQLAAFINPNLSKDSFHSIQISLGAETSEVSDEEATKNDFGCSFKISLCSEADPSEVQSRVKEVCDKLRKKAKKPKLDDLRVFLARLYVLQYMMSMEKVLHETLEKQEWGQKGICIWTKEQKDIIDEIMSDLKKGKVVKTVIQGGPGSGKTLMLQEIVKQALEVEVVEKEERERQRNVFVGVPSCNTELTELLKSKFQDKPGCRIGDESSKEAHGEDDWPDLIIWDEKGLEMMEYKDAFESLKSSKKSVIVFSLYSQSLQEFQTRRLVNGNLRSTKKISDFICDLEKSTRPSLDARFGLNQIPNGSQIQTGEEEPRIILVEDDSNDRSEFVKACEVEIIKTEKEWNKGENSKNKTTIMVSSIMNSELSEKLKEAMSSNKNISFGDPAEITGCQYPCVVVLVDLFSCVASEYHLQQAMTRATTSLVCVVNTTHTPTRISGHEPIKIEKEYSWQQNDEVINLIESTKATENKPVCIYDVEKRWRNDKVREKAEVVQHYLFDKNMCITQEKKNSSLNICNGKFPGEDVRRLMLFNPTVWLLEDYEILGEEKNELEEAKKVLNLRNKDNEVTIDFFKRRLKSQDVKTQHDSATQVKNMKQAEHNAEVTNNKDGHDEEKIVESNMKFSGGYEFIAASFHDSILVWGGSEDFDGEKLRLTNVIDKYSIKTQTWCKIEAKGEIHPDSLNASCIVVNNAENDELAYIFGGSKRPFQEMTNQLSTLSPNGKFSRVDVNGKQVLPRIESSGWSFNGNLYFAFGESHMSNYQALADARDGRDFMKLNNDEWEKGKDHTIYSGNLCTNEILEFNRKEKIFTRFDTKGTRPSPRYGSAVAAINEKVFVLGGYGGGGDLSDFFQLDMNTREWTRLVDYHHDLFRHSLSVISPNELMLVNDKEPVARIYNINDASWKDGPRLPPTKYGKESGLYYHKAVEVKEGEVEKIICLGGERTWNYGYGFWKDESSEMVELLLPPPPPSSPPPSSPPPPPRPRPSATRLEAKSVNTSLGGGWEEEDSGMLEIDAEDDDLKKRQ